MQHLSDGTLRRLYDEPLALSPAERRHYAACAGCRSRFTAIAGDARAVAGVLAVPDARIDAAIAFARVQQRIAADGGAVSMPLHRRLLERLTTMYDVRRPRLVKPLSGVVAAAAIIGALALTPVGSLAQNVLTIFQPTQIVAVPVTLADLRSLRSLPNLDAYGTMGTVTQPQYHEVASAAEAVSVTGLTLHMSASLPSGIPSTITYEVATRATATFTFSAAKARAAAAASGKVLPPMPAGIDGSVLQATAGPAVVAVYGGSIHKASLRHGTLPSLVIGQAAVPRVSSTGASVRELEDYLLRQPGVSPTLASEIRAIGDPNTTLPIPIAVNRETATPVQVQGVSGLAIGDNTGVGSVVVWVKDGMVYGVGGQLPESQVLDIANSLH